MSHVSRVLLRYQQSVLSWVRQPRLRHHVWGLPFFFHSPQLYQTTRPSAVHAYHRHMPSNMRSLRYAASECAQKCFQQDTCRVRFQMKNKHRRLPQPSCTQRYQHRACRVTEKDASLRWALTVKMVYSSGTTFKFSSVTRWKHSEVQNLFSHPSGNNTSVQFLIQNKFGHVDRYTRMQLTSISELHVLYPSSSSMAGGSHIISSVYILHSLPPPCEPPCTYKHTSLPTDGQTLT